VASLSAPLLDRAGAKAGALDLAGEVFGAAVKHHLVHETVRAEAAAARAGTRAAKSRGLVAGGRAKPWRQKGTGRARQGTTRAPQWTGGGVAFPPQPRSFVLKVNRKARKGALRSALTRHAHAESVGVIDASGFGEPSTKAAASLLAGWGCTLPLLVVARPDEHGLIRSFRNLERTLVLVPSELEVGALVWARSLLLSQGALEDVQERAR
jgi:large subunit ribosomal protein L4